MHPAAVIQGETSRRNTQWMCGCRRF
jgi:hypothetical protein